MPKLTSKEFIEMIEPDVDRHFPRGSKDRMKAFSLFADVTRTLEANNVTKAVQ